LKVNGKALNIIGLDDPVNKKSELTTALKGLDINGSPSILLAHSPEIFEEASTYGFDLLLCGHSHAVLTFAAFCPCPGYNSWR
jgi:predicted MPP superfamily phosphohydrolase